MKRAGAALFLLAIDLSAQTGGVVEGTVADAVAHGPLAGVTVTLDRMEQSPKQAKGEGYSATSDRSGVFRIAGVAPGDYTLVFEKDGFWPGIRMTVRARVGVTTRADVALERLGIVRGRVLDPDGKPVPKAPVTIGPFGEEQKTDAEGRFEIQDLPPGVIWLSAAMPPRQAPAKTEAAADRTEVVPTYYPSTANLAEAELIQIRPGADLSGYDIHLRTSRVYRLRGVVLDETRKPIPKAEVALLSPGENRVLAGRLMFGPQVPVGYFTNQRGRQDEVATAIAGQDGAFEFASVPPGDWSLRAHKPNNATLLASSLVKAVVSDRDIDVRELQIAPPFSLEVTADWGGQQPPPATGVPPVIVLPQNGSQFMVAPRAGLKPVLAPGQYRVLAMPNSAPGFYPAAVMLGNRDVQGQNVELTSAMPDIRVMYKPNPGKVLGTAEDGEGATVLLWPLGAAFPDIVATVRAGLHGVFEFSNISPGDYAVFAFDRVPQQGAPEALLGAAIARGQRVSVGEGGVESVQITVMRWSE